MAKRAPILSQNYNPVGARLRGALAPIPISTDVEGGQGDKEPLQVKPADVLKLMPQELNEGEGRGRLPAVQRFVKEIKESYLRFRCTDAERKKWHDITREITGEHNQLSHVMRACLLVLENSYDELKKVSPDIQRMKRPSSQDSMGLAIYEQRISQYLFDAIKAAGRPKG
jgi:hypothetical protein